MLDQSEKTTDNSIQNLNISYKGNESVGNPLFTLNGQMLIMNYDNAVHKYFLESNSTQILMDGDKARDLYPIAMPDEYTVLFLKKIDSKTYQLNKFSFQNVIENEEHVTIKDLNQNQTEIDVFFKDYEIRDRNLWVYEETLVTEQSEWLGGKSDPEEPFINIPIAKVKVLDIFNLQKNVKKPFKLSDQQWYEPQRYFTVSTNQNYIAMLYETYILIYKVTGDDYEFYNRIHIAKSSCRSLLFLPDDGLFCQDEDMRSIRYFQLDLEKNQMILPIFQTYTIIGFSTGFIVVVLMIVIWNYCHKKKKKRDIEKCMLDYSTNIKQSWIMNSSPQTARVSANVSSSIDSNNQCSSPLRNTVHDHME